MKYAVMVLRSVEATAVVTVSYNSSGQLDSFLSSLDNEIRAGVRVVIADNASGDTAETQRIADAHGAQVLPLSDNLGYGGAVNRAVASLSASVDAVLICNPDVLVGEDALDTLRERLDADPTIGAVGPRILNEDGTLYPSARRIPSLRTGIGHALFVRVWPANPWTKAYRSENQVSARDVGWLSGACLLVRRSVFEELGGFDEGYFMYFEDVDLGYRVGRAGFRNRYEPAASVVHVGGLSTQAESRRMVRVHHASAYRFLANKYRGPLLAPVRAVLRAALAARAWLLTRRP
ncbi:glycosyltransferase family 2 protein [Leifsonia soli]|uniref:N-acetylglucosaminyl-diphospho-decaprenol L-rhamnosyltransferase n=1 Tax=Leifsonia soli TaxID=582665 RepID=A0A852SV64_9MICO|nr:glycosyltransferase family 2 protein [Leifsonia soli]NYD72615.1 N-acetylglucosaminyl-diphospho-decaprenol L-rhamnosyltransferase [Leifsonia soli]